MKMDTYINGFCSSAKSEIAQVCILTFRANTKMSFKVLKNSFKDKLETSLLSQGTQLFNYYTSKLTVAIK